MSVLLIQMFADVSDKALGVLLFVMRRVCIGWLTAGVVAQIMFWEAANESRWFHIVFGFGVGIFVLVHDGIKELMKRRKNLEKN